jgi:hypothetical protein
LDGNGSYAGSAEEETGGTESAGRERREAGGYTGEMYVPIITTLLTNSSSSSDE